jgi:hypothetical protein
MADAKERDLARRSWDQATKGITGISSELAEFREKFVAAITEGGPMDELDRDLEDKLSELDWTWPWFEEWHTRFSEWKMNPHLWPPMQPEPDENEPYTPDELAAYRKAAIAPLIAHTAAMIFYRDRHLERSHGFEKYRLMHRNDGAEMRVATEKEIAIMSGDMSSLPPFFPGDRTSLEPIKPLEPKGDARPDKEGDAAAGSETAAPEGAPATPKDSGPTVN